MIRVPASFQPQSTPKDSAEGEFSGKGKAGKEFHMGSRMIPAIPAAMLSHQDLYYARFHRLLHDIGDLYREVLIQASTTRFSLGQLSTNNYSCCPLLHYPTCLGKQELCLEELKECCQSLEADVFIKLCILKPDMKFVASGAAEKHAVTTLEGASQRGQRGAGKGLSPCQKLQDEEKSNSSRTYLFHPLCSVSGRGVQTTNCSKLWHQAQHSFPLIVRELKPIIFTPNEMLFITPCDVLCMRMTAHAKCQRGHLIWLVENEPCDVQTKICYPLEGSHHCQQAKRSKLLISCVWNEARARLEHRPFFAHTSNPLHYQPLRCRLPLQASLRSMAFYLPIRDMTGTAVTMSAATMADSEGSGPSATGYGLHTYSQSPGTTQAPLGITTRLMGRLLMKVPAKSIRQICLLLLFGAQQLQPMTAAEENSNKHQDGQKMFPKGFVPFVQAARTGTREWKREPTATRTHLPQTPVSSSSLSLRMDQTLPSSTQKLGAKPAALCFFGGAAGAGPGSYSETEREISVLSRDTTAVTATGIQECFTPRTVLPKVMAFPHPNPFPHTMIQQRQQCAGWFWDGRTHRAASSGQLCIAVPQMSLHKPVWCSWGLLSAVCSDRKIILTFGDEDHVYVAFVSGILRDFSAENLRHF
ncbi:hypothetical protein Anapl_07963 [Anas platyrhynchos]|uniref:Uncharacterized protein n=1 Tax=Anas platyrhynchos TaxID=8839 RepID=R0JQ49_ANAPL|nr:hypothetical protein Anapl_07963 [Anas platyrhynchos]